MDFWHLETHVVSNEDSDRYACIIRCYCRIGCWDVCLESGPERGVKRLWSEGIAGQSEI